MQINRTNFWSRYNTSEKFQFLVVENAFMFQMLEGTKIFTLPGKVPL